MQATMVREEDSPRHLALVGVIALWGLRDFEHRRAVDVVRSGSYEGAAPIRASAYPYWWTPFRWYSVAETQNSLTTMVDSSALRLTRRFGFILNQSESPVTLAAKRSFLGRVYLDWAQYPMVQSYRITDSDVIAYRVQFQDLRYAYPDMVGRAALSAAWNSIASWKLLRRASEAAAKQFHLPIELERNAITSPSLTQAHLRATIIV